MSTIGRFLLLDGTARTRDGRVVEELRAKPGANTPFVFTGVVYGYAEGTLSSRETWTAEGRFLNDGSESELDLVPARFENQMTATEAADRQASPAPEADPFRNYVDEALERAIAVADAQTRKSAPVVTGVLDYFPLAIMEIARCSLQGSKQHHPDELMHWDREKSGDEADALGRHLIERGKFDTDGIRHTTKVAWRALALLQKELEQSKQETL